MCHFGQRLRLSCRYRGSSAALLTHDTRWLKWSLKLLPAIIPVCCYSGMLLLPLTKWRDVLPARPSFFVYVEVVLCVYVSFVVGCILVGMQVGAGYCLVAATMLVYYALYHTLLYVTFVAEFFADDQLDLDLLYYSEMREAGCFDAGNDGV
jgi:hypothetical protein